MPISEIVSQGDDTLVGLAIESGEVSFFEYLLWNTRLTEIRGKLQRQISCV